MNSQTLDLYPHNFVDKIGFVELRQLLADHCASSLGRERMLSLEASADYERISLELEETREMMQLLTSEHQLPSLQIVDCREALHRIRPQGTYVEELELQDLLRMLETLHALHRFFTEEQSTGDRADESLVYLYPRLTALLEDRPTFPKVEQHLRSLLTEEGRLRDNASRELLQIRRTHRDRAQPLGHAAAYPHGRTPRGLGGAGRAARPTRWAPRDPRQPHAQA